MKYIMELLERYNLEYVVRVGKTGVILSLTVVKSDRYWIIIKKSDFGQDLYFADWDKAYHGDQIRLKDIKLTRVHEILTNKLRA